MMVASLSLSAVHSGTAMEAGIGSEWLTIACFALGLIALGAIANVVAARKEARAASRLARSRAEEMREFLQTVRMAERIAGIGVWQYDPTTGTQQWSSGLKQVFGIDGEEPFVAGDAETVLFANDVDLIGAVTEHLGDDGPYEMQFDIRDFSSEPRRICVQACNLMGSSGRVHRVVAVVRDVTEQAKREQALAKSRREAMDEAQQARMLAQTDPLTGLANRRQVMAELDRRVVDAKMTQMPLVLVIFDIDHFKQVNDTHGHPEGDKVLRRVAQLAKAQARGSDLMGRVGGEEFVWIIPGTSETMARIMTERLRQAIARGSGIGSVPSVTISLGYTGLQAGDTALSMFARADNALYEAKNSGRNRVRMAA